MGNSNTLLARVVVSAESIRRRVSEMAEEIDRQYRQRFPLVLGVMKGSLYFLADLTRQLKVEHQIDFVRVSTYPNGSSATASPQVESWKGLDIANRDILVVDDILDMGHTSQAVSAFLNQHNPRSVTWAVLVAKEGAMVRSGLHPDFLGFEIPNVWVVGYGMDYNERFRNLPDIHELTVGAWSESAEIGDGSILLGNGGP